MTCNLELQPVAREFPVAACQLALQQECRPPGSHAAAVPSVLCSRVLTACACPVILLPSRFGGLLCSIFPLPVSALQNFMMRQRFKDPVAAIDSGALPGAWLKAIDFGCSQSVAADRMLTSRRGTPVYMAPGGCCLPKEPGLPAVGVHTGRRHNLCRVAHDCSPRRVYLLMDLIPVPAICRGIQAGVWAGGRHVEPGHDVVSTADRALPLVVSPLPAALSACEPSL